MDLEALERAIAQDTHTLILCNPQNPTGNVWSKEDLLAVGEICLRRRVVVLSDEIHRDFVHAGRDEITTLGMVAHRAAYTEGDAWLDQARTYLDGNLSFVADYVKRNIPLIRS